MRTEAAKTASEIRKELKAAFPGVNFSVKSQTFSGGNSVDIKWADGPTRDKVTDITAKYQYGHFNGMEDCYEYTNRRDDIPQAKYVSTQRDMSERTKEFLQKWADERFSATTFRSDWDFGRFKNEQVYEEFCKWHMPELLWDDEVKQETKKEKIGRGYFRSGYGRGFKQSPVVWAINGKAYVKDANSYPFQTDLPGYTMVNESEYRGEKRYHQVDLIREHRNLQTQK